MAIDMVWRAIRGPGKARSAFLGRGGARERSETWPSGRGERCGLCPDDVAPHKIKWCQGRVWEAAPHTRAPWRFSPYSIRAADLSPPGRPSVRNFFGKTGIFPLLYGQDMIIYYGTQSAKNAQMPRFGTQPALTRGFSPARYAALGQIR